MKRQSLVFGSIIFLALATAVLASGFNLFNNNPTLTGNINSLLNGSLIITNTGADPLTVSLIDFRNFQNSKFTFPISAFSHTGNGLQIPVGQSKQVNYTVNLNNNPYAATYNGQINVTVFNATGSFLDGAAALSVVVLPKKNATMSVSTATIVQGQTGQATISVNNIGNTDLSFTSFLPGTIFNSTGWPLTSSISYPANLDAAYSNGNNTNFSMTVLPSAAAGTYSYNLTISDGAGLNVIAPATLIIQAIAENLQSSSQNGQLKVDGTNVISQRAIPITLTNNGNVDEPVSITISNLYSTSNSSNSIAASTLSYNPSNSVTVGKNSGVQNINVTTNIGGSIPLGQYRGNLTVIYGNCIGCSQKTINSTVLLDVVQAQASLSVPNVVVDGKRNTTSSALFTVSNTGDFPLVIQSMSTNADSRYNVTYSVVGNNFNIPVGGNTTINVTLYTPSTQSSGIVSIGTTTVRTDRINATGDLAIGTQSSLVFSDMDVKSSESSTHFRLSDQNSTAPIKPGSTLTVKSTALNNFTTSTRIRDITVTARINEINRLYEDEDSFLEQETAEFSLNSQSSKTNTFDFTIPLRVEAKNYTLEIIAEGVDETNARQKATWTMSLDLEKSDDSVATQLSVSPSSLNCGNTATLKVDLTNTGSDDQDAVSVVISSDPFRIAQGYLNISLSGDARDDESTHTINHDFTIPTGLNTTSYPISVETRYAGKTDRNTISVPVSGSQCTGVEEVSVTQPTQGGQTVASIPGSLFFESGKVWYKQPWYLALLIAADGLLLIIILWLLIGAIKRRR